MVVRQVLPVGWACLPRLSGLGKLHLDRIAYPGLIQLPRCTSSDLRTRFVCLVVLEVWRLILSQFITGVPVPIGPQLPVDNSLVNAGAAPFMSAAAFGSDQLPSSSKTTMVVVTEGIPPVALNLVEKICRWEYIDLADLLKGPHGKDQQQWMIVSGQVVFTPRQKTTLSITRWLKVYSIFQQSSCHQQKQLRRKQLAWQLMFI